MRRLEGRLLLGATDLSDFLSCEHLTQLSLRVADGERLPTTTSAMRDLLRRLGDTHESGWLAQLESSGRCVKHFDAGATRHATAVAELEAAHDATASAMREGWDIIYQPFFFDGRWPAAPFG
jgi:uncharacterized protein